MLTLFGLSNWCKPIYPVYQVKCKVKNLKTCPRTGGIADKWQTKDQWNQEEYSQISNTICSIDCKINKAKTEFTTRNFFWWEEFLKAGHGNVSQTLYIKQSNKFWVIWKVHYFYLLNNWTVCISLNWLAYWGCYFYLYIHLQSSAFSQACTQATSRRYTPRMYKQPLSTYFVLNATSKQESNIIFWEPWQK